MLWQNLNVYYGERWYLRKLFGKGKAHLKSQFFQLPPIAREVSVFFYAALHMIYRFVYTVHSVLKFSLVRKHLLLWKIDGFLSINENKLETKTEFSDIPTCSFEQSF